MKRSYLRWLFPILKAIVGYLQNHLSGWGCMMNRAGSGLLPALPVGHSEGSELFSVYVYQGGRQSFGFYGNGEGPFSFGRNEGGTVLRFNEAAARTGAEVV